MYTIENVSNFNLISKGNLCYLIALLWIIFTCIKNRNILSRSFVIEAILCPLTYIINIMYNFWVNTNLFDEYHYLYDDDLFFLFAISYAFIMSILICLICQGNIMNSFRPGISPKRAEILKKIYIYLGYGVIIFHIVIIWYWYPLLNHMYMILI